MALLLLKSIIILKHQVYVSQEAEEDKEKYIYFFIPSQINIYLFVLK